MPALHRSTLLLAVPLTLVAALMAPQAAGAVQPLLVSTAMTASILSPADGDTVGGADVFVDALGSVDSVAGGGQPESLTLLVDGTVADSQACSAAPTPTSCESVLDWNTNGAALGAHQLTVELTTTLTTSAPSTPVNITLIALPAPAVSITTPTAGSTVSGNVTITATGSVDPSLGDFPLFMGLLVDGTLVGNIKNCPATGSTCTLSFPWDASALPGTHTLQVGIATDQNDALSAPVVVTVFNPPPVAVITAPLASATVSGFTTVTAVGTVDARGGDAPQSLEFLVDGVSEGDAGCAATALTCSRSMAWNTAGLVGRHNLQVRFTTKHTSVLSPVTTVDVAPLLTKLQLDGQRLIRRGAQVSVTGVLYTSGGSVASSAPVQVTFTPAVGQPVTVSATTNTRGRFVAADPLPVLVNTRVRAVAGAAYGASAAGEMLSVSTPITCALPAKAKHGVKVTVTCNAPLLPNGVAVTLRDLDRGTHVLATAKAKNGRVRLTFSLPKKRKYPLEIWATTAASARYGPTLSPVYRIRAL
ncbi:MAG: hypothetical protein QOJ11_1470 [Frankiales bacterium]|nr:hypothetical protein [Frankiales bacterium]